MSDDVKRTESAGNGTLRLLRKALPAMIMLAAALAVVILAVALPAKTNEAGSIEPPPVNVVVEIVKPMAELVDSVVLNGVVEANRIVMVAAEVSGQIKSYGKRETAVSWLGRNFPVGSEVAEGEPVKAGDPIALLDADLLQAEYDRAKAQAEFHARECARMTQLYEQNAASTTELDQCKTTLLVSTASLAVARKRLDRTVIRSPLDGVLNRLPQEIGQFVQPGDYVAEIVEIQIAKIIVDVPEKDISYFSVGDTAEVIIDPAGGKSITGKITFISELADERTRTTPLEVLVDNADRLLRSGKILRVRLTRQVLKDAIMIPFSSAIPLESGRVVYVVEGDKAQPRQVTLAMRFTEGARIHVLKGLHPGDRLIVKNHRYVGPGQKVHVVGYSSPDGGLENVDRQ